MMIYNKYIHYKKGKVTCILTSESWPSVAYYYTDIYDPSCNIHANRECNIHLLQVLALASLAQVLVCSKNEKCDLYVICMEQYSIFCH